MPRRSRLAQIAYALAAVPAVFLPGCYLFVVLYGLATMPSGLEAPDGSPPLLSPPVETLGWAGIGAFLVQWPFYVLWAAFTPGLTGRVRAVWIFLLTLLNLFAIPWFLFAMYRGTAQTTFQQQTRRRQAPCPLQPDSMGCPPERLPEPTKPGPLPLGGRIARFCGSSVRRLWISYALAVCLPPLAGAPLINLASQGPGVGPTLALCGFLLLGFTGLFAIFLCSTTLAATLCRQRRAAGLGGRGEFLLALVFHLGGWSLFYLLWGATWFVGRGWIRHFF